MTSTTDSSSSLESDLNIGDKRSLLKTLIRYVLRTFYPLPSSLVLEYIYHHECIHLADLARLLHSSTRQVQSNIESFKRSGIIIEEHRRNTNSSGTFDPSTVFYKIDLVVLINVVKYRLIKIQSDIENFEREESNSNMVYHCKHCSQKYTEFDIAQLLRSSSGDDLLCPKCQHIISEYDPTEEEPVQCSVRLFHHQMTPLFQILERIDEVMEHESPTTSNDKMTVVIEKDIVRMDTDEQTSTTMKSLPEWFTRSID